MADRLTAVKAQMDARIAASAAIRAQLPPAGLPGMHDGALRSIDESLAGIGAALGAAHNARRGTFIADDGLRAQYEALVDALCRADDLARKLRGATHEALRLRGLTA